MENNWIWLYLKLGFVTITVRSRQKKNETKYLFALFNRLTVAKTDYKGKLVTE